MNNITNILDNEIKKYIEILINEKFNNLIELKNDTDIKDEVKELKRHVNTLRNDLINLNQEDEDEEEENKMELIKLENNKIINRIKKHEEIIKKHEKLINLLEKQINLLMLKDGIKDLKDVIKDQSHAIKNIFATF